MRWVWKLFRFLAAGLPAFLLALGLNYLLVTALHVPKILAYVPVLVIQVFVNFLMCRTVLFPAESRGTPFWQQFSHFAGGSLLFRMADWGLYAVWTWLGLYFLLAQLVNVALFSVGRFLFAEWLFGKAKLRAARSGKA